MHFDQVINAFALPADARVDRRVPKMLMLEQGAPTAADKRIIQDGIEELVWVAALKPTNIAVPVFKDDAREYLEISILTVSFRADAKTSRLVELIHRAIPYPLVLVDSHDDAICVSVAHKRWSQGEGGKVVIEDVRRTSTLHLNTVTSEERSFLGNIGLSTLPNRDLMALYQGWIDRVAALEAARITGMFASPNSPTHAAAVRNGVDAHSKLQRDIATLRSRAAKEKQMNRRVELNLEVKRLESELADIMKTLQPGAKA